MKAQSDAFGKAFNACDIPAAIALYEDNATMIWPGEGEVATGKAGIKKIIKTECAGAAKGSLKQVSSESQAIGKNYIINIGMWDSIIPRSRRQANDSAGADDRAFPQIGGQVALRDR